MEVNQHRRIGTFCVKCNQIICICKNNSTMIKADTNDPNYRELTSKEIEDMNNVIKPKQMETKLKEANDLLTKIQDSLSGQIEMDKDVIAHYNDLYKLIIQQIELWKLNQ